MIQTPWEPRPDRAPVKMQMNSNSECRRLQAGGVTL